MNARVVVVLSATVDLTNVESPRDWVQEQLLDAAASAPEGCIFLDEAEVEEVRISPLSTAYKS